MLRSDSASPRLSTCGRSVCLREKAKRCRTRPAARLAFWRICMMSWNEGSVGLWAFTRKSVAIMMAPSTLLKSWAMPPASLPTSSIFCDWVELVLQRALLGGLDAVDDCRLVVAHLLLDRGDVEAGIALARTGERGIDRRDLALLVGCLAQRRLQRGPVALGHHRQDGAAVGTVALEHRAEQPREQHVGADDLARLVDGRDRHRGVVEEAHETHFGQRAAGRSRGRARG